MAEQIEQAGNNGSVLTFRLGNADFSVKRELWPVEKLRLDPNNQRLGYLLRQHKKAPTVNDAELHKILWDIDQVKALYQSVYQNGGLLEDPVVRVDSTVVEGNCRTVVMRELHKKYSDDDRFSKVWVRVLPPNVTEEQISLLLGELHIAGKIEWRAFDQAEYVWKMNKVHGKTYDFLSTHLRWSRSKLSQKISAFEETRAYLERTGDPQGINRFSHFEEFMRKKPLRDWTERDPDFMRRFGQWVFDGKLPESKDVRDLPAILENADALHKFEKEGIRAARVLLQDANPSMVSNLYSAIDQASAELETISLQEITALQDGNEARLEKLRRLARTLRKIESFAGIKLS
ncbi:MAG: hypothetical protein HONDAALG_02900 [Gammaproteobacteria bacterium]|nr:hypothetical protein [Gammaproteobacteria bacterium]